MFLRLLSEIELGLKRKVGDHILAKHGRHSHDAMFGDQKQRQLDDLDRLKGKYEQQI
jgi:hypothetical protein